MRDLGEMGESSFNLWCAQAGLVANGSKIDKTGWDFLVEFPFETTLGSTRIHESATECKIQVKATDKEDRKIQIKLSNLRRLITAPMPAFFCFIEFSGKDVAQRAFLVHVDANLISRTLKRIHELENIQGNFDHNNRSLTINYSNQHEIHNTNGKSLKEKIEIYLPDGMNKYVSEKNRHLATTGFERGFAQITFHTDGDDSLVDLVDVSLGLEPSVKITNFRESQIRFGMKTNPRLISAAGEIQMSNLKPAGIGSIRFREDGLSAGVIFPCKFYASPLNATLPDNLKKFRIEADCFDISMNPYSGAADYRFNAGAGLRLAIDQLRDAVFLMRLITSSAKIIYISLTLNDGKNLSATLHARDKPFKYNKTLETLNAAVNICRYFDLTERPQATLEEMGSHSQSIIQFWSLITADPTLFRCEFSVDGSGYDERKQTAVISLATSKIGSHVFGIILVCTGLSEKLSDGRYSLPSKNTKIERKIVSSSDEIIDREDLVRAIEAVEVLYEKDFQVLTNFDKGPQKSQK